MTTLIDFVALTEPDLLPTEEVCRSCRLAKHAAAFGEADFEACGPMQIVETTPDEFLRLCFRVCRDCVGGGA